MIAALSIAQRWAIGGGILVVAALALWLWIGRADEADDRNNQAIGATVQREADMTQTIERVEKANAAREDTIVGSVEFYYQCLRTARTPDNCQRFLPE